MIFKAKWDNIAILFSCKVKSSCFSSFKTLDVDISVSVRILFFKINLTLTKMGLFPLIVLCKFSKLPWCPSPDTHTVVRHGQCLAKFQIIM